MSIMLNSVPLKLNVSLTLKIFVGHIPKCTFRKGLVGFLPDVHRTPQGLLVENSEEA
jgi:hypothetical protein